MPCSGILFLFLSENGEFSGVFVEFFVEFDVDGADFWVGDAVAFTFRVEDGVDMEADVFVFPAARPRLWMSSFWRSAVKLSWDRKKTTPRWETN